MSKIEPQTHLHSSKYVKKSRQVTPVRTLRHWNYPAHSWIRQRYSVVALSTQQWLYPLPLQLPIAISSSRLQYPDLALEQPSLGVVSTRICVPSHTLVHRYHHHDDEAVTPSKPFF